MKVTGATIWGLTGNISSGKSTIAQILIDQGIPVIDADAINRQLYEENSDAAPILLKTFKTLDRAKIREIIFSDPVAKKKLEQILHPLIHKIAIQLIKNLVTQNKSSKPLLVFYDAALIFETGLDKKLAGVVLVTAPEELRRTRLIARNFFDTETAQKIIKSQMPESEKIKKAQFIIKNEGSLEQLKENTLKVLAKIKI